MAAVVKDYQMPADCVTICESKQFSFSPPILSINLVHTNVRAKLELHSVSEFKLLVTR